ncbi:MAG TPA: hypothetical protein PKY42_12260 [Mesotoga sp.]|jgi:hypothetical protein|nr:hypothetical protein [Thermotogaceae bacterium]HOI34432.1 hypothetical protein [Mesotoga infera]HOI63395.1 hypothetical protein [Mesotoga sp.]HQQ57355.1 hypothetical protein [Mesotoga sp.]
MREGVRGKKSKTFLLFQPLTSNLRFPKDGFTLPRDVSMIFQLEENE